VRYLSLEGKAIVFFCDDCGKRLDDFDPGEAYWEDYNRFIETIGQPNEEPTLLLCYKCFKARGGPEKDWHDPEWRHLV